MNAEGEVLVNLRPLFCPNQAKMMHKKEFNKCNIGGKMTELTQRGGLLYLLSQTCRFWNRWLSSNMDKFHLTKYNIKDCVGQCSCQISDECINLDK